MFLDKRGLEPYIIGFVDGSLSKTGCKVMIL
jgi:hypothetical protein